MSNRRDLPVTAEAFKTFWRALAESYGANRYEASLLARELLDEYRRKPANYETAEEIVQRIKGRVA